MPEDVKKVSWFAKHKILSGIIGLLILGWIVNSFSSTKVQPTVQTANQPTAKSEIQQQPSKLTDNSQTEPAAPAVTKPASDKPTTSFGDGEFIVGTDIEAGTYRTRAASPGCYYSRVSGFSGSLSEIIANDNTDGPAVVTIAKTDAGFKSVNCGTWTQDLTAITTDKTTFGEGTFIVGTDVQAGTYRNSGGEGCYYARLSGFGGTTSDIIANENTDTTAIVTIISTDKGFRSTRCGTWSKIK